MTTATRLIAALLLIATLLYPQGKKSKKGAPLQIAIEKIEVRREGDVVTLDGTVRNTGPRVLEGLILQFQFFAPNRESLTTMKGPVESASIEPGDSAEFRLQVRYPSRSVELKVGAQDKDKRDMIVEKDGPYTIE